MNKNDAYLDDLYAGTLMSRHAKTIQCHFCHCDLHEHDNVMIRMMDGREPASRGFGWIFVIVAPFREVPCCDICMEKRESMTFEEIVIVKVALCLLRHKYLREYVVSKHYYWAEMLPKVNDAEMAFDLIKENKAVIKEVGVL